MENNYQDNGCFNIFRLLTVAFLKAIKIFTQPTVWIQDSAETKDFLNLGIIFF